MGYREHARDTLIQLKEINDIREAWIAALPIDDGGYLLPVCETFVNRSDIISLFSKWRDENQFAYPTRFTITDEGTARWLRKGVLGTTGRILFFVVSSKGVFVGHMGLNDVVNDMGSAEFDNIVRGCERTEKGIMSRAMQSLESWAHEALGVTSLFLRVLNDNNNAISFYERLGWKIKDEIPLRKTVKDNGIYYVEEEGLSISKADKVFLKMCK